jgi:predicted GH43/DUF377 family glycosyl hydrolase
MRSEFNPIITPADVKPSREGFEVIGVFNAGVARFENEVILLLRVAERPTNPHSDVVLAAVYDVGAGGLVTKEFSKDDPKNDFSDPRLIIVPDGTYLTSISHLRVARSTDGVTFEIQDSPALFPASEYEAFGVEDPRISPIDGVYYISYVAVSSVGVTTCLASTDDFVQFRRHGVVFCPENKDVTLWPEKISGRYYALHRPSSPLVRRNEMWIAESPDLICWGNHRHLVGPRPESWDEAKIGPSAVPFRIQQGWLEVYHGADRNNRYCLGALVLDSHEPWKVIARSERPIFEPETDYECAGFFGNVVFSCGLLYEGDMLKMYYGAADTTICYAELSLRQVLESMSL